MYIVKAEIVYTLFLFVLKKIIMFCTFLQLGLPWFLVDVLTHSEASIISIPDKILNDVQLLYDPIVYGFIPGFGNTRHEVQLGIVVEYDDVTFGISEGGHVDDVIPGDFIRVSPIDEDHVA